MSCSRPFPQLHILDCFAIDGEAQCSTHLVESVASCCAWVYVEKFVDLVVLDTQDVRVTRDENLRVGRLNLRQCLWRVVSRITANMGHKHRYLLHLEECEWLERVARVATVDIAIDRTQRFELGNLVRQLDRADIARVPNLVDIA